MKKPERVMFGTVSNIEVCIYIDALEAYIDKLEKRNSKKKAIKRYNKAVAYINQSDAVSIFTLLYNNDIARGLRIAAGLKKKEP